MSTLPHRIVVFPSFEKGVFGIDVPFKEDGVNGDGEKVTESRHDSMIGVQNWKLRVIISHFDSRWNDTGFDIDSQSMLIDTAIP